MQPLMILALSLVLAHASETAEAPPVSATPAPAEPASALRAAHRITARYDAVIEHYRQIVADGGWGILGDVGGLSVGAADPRVRRLRVRLQAQGFHPPDQPSASASLGGVAAAALPWGADPLDVYDPEVVAAVKRAQDAYDLAVDGVAGVRTGAALDVSAAERLAQLIAARASWLGLAGAPSERMLLANTAGAELLLYDDVAGDQRMTTVVGAALDGRETPVFSDLVERVVFGPYWDVPTGISVEELVPMGARALRRREFEVVRGGVAVPPSKESLRAVVDGQARIRQRPGPSNALGRVKFLFPNAYSVYLHDTPSQAAFDSSDRARSHGCVRVSDPEALALWLLRGEAGWTAGRVTSTLGSGKQEAINLQEPVPIHLVYWLASVDPDGGLRFHEDPYGIGGSLPVAE